MKTDLFEGLIIGGTIGLAVIAIRILLVGQASAAQATALIMAGILLSGAQIVLALRRARHSGGSVQDPPDSLPLWPASRRRLSRKNPFAQELTHNWTGLDDRLSDETQKPRTQEEEKIEDRAH
jgi:hypothetical protein